MGLVEVGALDDFLERPRAVDGLAVEARDHVELLDPGLGGRRAGDDVVDEHSLAILDAELRGHLAREGADLDAEVATLDAPLGDELSADPLGEVDRDCEADPLVAAVVGGDRRVDPHHLTGEVDQRSAGVARVDGGIGLEELGPLHAAEFAPLAADDPRADGRLQLEGIADGDHPIADLHLVGVAKLRHREVLGVAEADDGQVTGWIGLDLDGLVLPSVGEFHGDRVGPFDDVVVGEDDPGGVDDHPRADAGAARHPSAPFLAVWAIELKAFRRPLGKHVFKRGALEGIAVAATAAALVAGAILRLRLTANDDDARGRLLCGVTEGL